MLCIRETLGQIKVHTEVERNSKCLLNRFFQLLTLVYINKLTSMLCFLMNFLIQLT